VPRTAHAQQPALPVIGFLDSRSPDALADRLRGFRQGLKDTGYVDGENVAGRSGSPAAPRVTITSSPASAGLFLVRFRTILVWNGFLPLAFVIYRTNGAMGCDDQGRRVSRQGTRVRRTRRTDARFLYQGTIPRSCEEVAAHGRLRRKALAVSRPNWWPGPRNKRGTGRGAVDLTSGRVAQSAERVCEQHEVTGSKPVPRRQPQPTDQALRCGRPGIQRDTTAAFDFY
jgi:hypothetical protein